MKSAGLVVVGFSLLFGAFAADAQTASQGGSQGVVTSPADNIGNFAIIPPAPRPPIRPSRDAGKYRVGQVLSSSDLEGRHTVRRVDLPRVDAGYRWVRPDNDYLLVRSSDNMIADIRRGPR
jgi:nickel/cobalt transporter regulator